MITCGVVEIVYILIFQLICITSSRKIICISKFYSDSEKMNVRCLIIRILKNNRKIFIGKTVVFFIV